MELTNSRELCLGKLNQSFGDCVSAEMVKGFIVSADYRSRLGPWFGSFCVHRRLGSLKGRPSRFMPRNCLRNADNRGYRKQ
jgi:hypothetical protein